MDVLLMFVTVAIGIVAFFVWLFYLVAPVIWVIKKTDNPLAAVGMFLFTASSGITGFLQFVQWIK